MQKFWVVLYRASGVSVSLLIAILIMLPNLPYEAHLLRAFLASFVLFIVAALCVKKRRVDQQ